MGRDYRASLGKLGPRSRRSTAGISLRVTLATSSTRVGRVSTPPSNLRAAPRAGEIRPSAYHDFGGARQLFSVAVPGRSGCRGATTTSPSAARASIILRPDRGERLRPRRPAAPRGMRPPPPRPPPPPPPGGGGGGGRGGGGGGEARPRDAEIRDSTATRKAGTGDVGGATRLARRAARGGEGGGRGGRGVRALPRPNPGPSGTPCGAPRRLRERSVRARHVLLYLAGTIMRAGFTWPATCLASPSRAWSRPHRRDGLRRRHDGGGAGPDRGMAGGRPRADLPRRALQPV